MDIIPLNKTPGNKWWDVFLKDTGNKKNLFHTLNQDNVDLPGVFKKYVSIVNLETSSYCNRKCSYCPLSIYEKPQILMDYDLFENILIQLKSIGFESTLSLNLYNEPLADEDIFKRIEMARQYLPKAFIKFNSNGDFISKEVLDRLVKVGNSALFVTLHPGANKNYEDEDRLKHFKQFFKMAGLEMTIDSITPFKNITSDIDYKGMRLLIMANNWGEYGNSRASTIPALDSQKIRTSPCMRPFREFTIYHDGQIYPCCQFFPDTDSDNHYKVADLRVNQDIFAAFASSKMAGFRKDLFGFNEKGSPCDLCKDDDSSDINTADLRLKILTDAEE